MRWSKSSTRMRMRLSTDVIWELERLAARSADSDSDDKDFHSQTWRWQNGKMAKWQNEVRVLNKQQRPGENRGPSAALLPPLQALTTLVVP